MANKTINKHLLWRLRGSYITSIMSISLVLFLLGMLGFFVLNVGKISNYVKENIGFAVILKENVKEIEILKLQKQLDATNFVKTTKYIPKDQAAKELKSELGEDFVEFLGYNPLLSSIDLQLRAQYANIDSINKIERHLKKYSQVKEVYYQKSLVHLVNENVRKITIIIFIISLVLTMISVALINNTIRLSVYARRFLINTMKLVGATDDFIRKPFLIQSATTGIISGVLAILLLMGLINVAQEELYQVISLDHILWLFLCILIAGLMITVISSYIAVNRYLTIKPEELYY